MPTTKEDAFDAIKKLIEETHKVTIDPDGPDFLEEVVNRVGVALRVADLHLNAGWRKNTFSK